jgi:hypothetical protein
VPLKSHPAANTASQFVLELTRDSTSWRLLASRLALGAMFGLTLMWSAASFWFPFFWDQAILASVGDVVVRGGMPFRDGFDMKGPLAYYGFAAAQVLFGRHFWSIRVLDFPFLVCGAIALGRLTARVTSPLWGWWSGLVFALWIASLGWTRTVEPDTWSTVLTIFAVALLVEKDPAPLELGASALCIGLASLVKPLYLAFVILPLLSIAQNRERRSWGRAVVVIGSALIPPLAVTAWFAYRGALQDLIDVHILYTIKVYRPLWPITAVSAIKGIGRFFGSSPIIWGIPALATGVYTLARRVPRSAVLIVAWLVLATGCVAAQGRFFGYHWTVVFPPLVALCAAGVRSAVRAQSRMRAATIVPVLAAVAVLTLAVVPASDVARWLKLLTRQMSREQYAASFRGGVFSPAADVKAANYIREHTIPTDGVAVFGVNADINFLSGRPNPTRFYWSMPLTVGRPFSTRDVFRREYLEGVRRHPPVYFVVGVLPWDRSPKTIALHKFAELEELLNREYRLETKFGALDLYRKTERTELQ